MPRVTFVHEHRTVEVEPGRLVSDIAQELGIEICRESFAGTGVGSWLVWVDAAPGATSPRTFGERLRRLRGWQRLAHRTRILGDARIWTQQGLGDRLRSPRPVTPPEEPAKDPSAPRKPIDAAGTAAYPFGHPQAVGKGERIVKSRGADKAAKAKAGAAAATDADDAEADEDESE